MKPIQMSITIDSITPKNNPRVILLHQTNIALWKLTLMLQMTLTMPIAMSILKELSDTKAESQNVIFDTFPNSKMQKRTFRQF